ncbi:MAG: lysine-sensitive aspartokinase 3, partial [Acidobacteria bacterium]
MIVMKFGGTSVGDAESIERVIEIIRGRLPRRPVVVVSAMGKTTRRLLEAAQAAAEHNSTEAVAILRQLGQEHASEARRLVGSGAPAEVFRVIGGY